MISILVVEDHPVYRTGICRLIKRIANVSRCDEAENGKIAIEMLEKHKYNIVIMDLQMPVMSGYEAIDIIKRRFPETLIMVVSLVDTRKEVLAVLNKGVQGYLLKSTSEEEISRAFLYILDGNSYLSKEVSDIWALSQMNTTSYEKVECSHIEFSAREKEVIHLICEQQTNIEIAKKLCISVHTAKNHRSNIIGKIGADSSIGVVIYAIKFGLYKLDFADSFFKG